VRQGRRERGANGLRRTGVLLSVALVAAAFAHQARAADDSVPPPSPPSALVFASTASIAPDVPETSGITDAATPVDASALPSDPPAAPVTVPVAKKPAKDAGWVEVRPVSHRASSVIPAPSAVVPHASTPATPPATHHAAVKRRVPQYHRRPGQYHGADRAAGPAQPTRVLLVPMPRPDGALVSAEEAPSDDSPDPDGTCTSAPPICPDLCGDVPVQNSLQNIAEIVRCIVNGATQEIASGDNGSLPDSGPQLPPEATGDTSDGQYHCDDPQYQGPPCEQSPTAATPAAPPAETPAPDAAPTATPTPTSGPTTGPSVPTGATSSGPSTTHGGADQPSTDDGWQLVRAAPHRPPARHAVLAAARVPATSPHEVAEARVAIAVPRSRKTEQPERGFAPASRGGHYAALATATRASGPADSDAWPLRTVIALLAFASLALCLAAVAKENGGGAAASVRARLGSRGLSRRGGSAANRKRGVRYRE
jgi:hypothetical protein